MNVSVAQVVALTCWGNAFLQGNDVCEFFLRNSTCESCDRVAFLVFDKPFFGKLKEREVAETPEEWFRFLKSRGARGIRLLHTPQNDPGIPDRMSAAFIGGGGTWSMEVVLPKRKSEFWVSRWRLWNQVARNHRIWRSTYGRVSKGRTARSQPVDLQDTATEFAQALREIHAFSKKHRCGEFTEWLADALEMLESGGMLLRADYEDMAPDGYLSARARTILYACQRAWVFGGMGSWNDMGFPGPEQEEYDRVSEQLFQSLNRAICDAINESCNRLEQAM